MTIRSVGGGIAWCCHASISDIDVLAIDQRGSNVTSPSFLLDAVEVALVGSTTTALPEVQVLLQHDDCNSVRVGFSDFFTRASFLAQHECCGCDFILVLPQQPQVPCEDEQQLPPQQQPVESWATPKQKDLRSPLEQMHSKCGMPAAKVEPAVNQTRISWSVRIIRMPIP